MSPTEKRLLLVEPSMDYAIVLANELQRMGCIITLKNRMFDTFHYLLLHRPLPELVVCNYWLPDHPGTALYECVKNFIFLEEISFLFYTRFEEDREKLKNERKKYPEIAVIFDLIDPKILLRKVTEILGLSTRNNPHLLSSVEKIATKFQRNNLSLLTK